MTRPEALTARRALDQLGQRSMRTGQRLSQHTGSTTTLACDVGLGLLDLDQLHSSTEIEPVERGRHRVMRGHESARAQRLQHSPEGEGTSLCR